MLNRILEFSVRQRVLIVLATLVLIAAGLWSAMRLPIDAVPDITHVQVQLNTAVSAYAPEEVEKLVTYPIEMEMAGIEGMEQLRSLSKFGLSQVNLIFKDGTDIYRARQLVSERLQNLQEKLPAGTIPKLAPITTGLGEIYYYLLDYKKEAADKPATRREQLMELKLVQDFVVKPQLRMVPGVAEVNTSGGHEKQIVVMPDPTKLMSVGLTFMEIAQTVKENVENAGGGVVQVGGQQLAVRAVGRVQTVEEIALIPLKLRAGADPLRVRDVAEVGIGSSLRTGASTYNGQEAVIGAALMLTGENSRVVAKAVGEKIQAIASHLPSNVEITPVYDRSVLVNRTIHTVEKNLFEGAILVVVILFLLLGNVRAAIIVALAIPLSMLFAITGMVQNRISGNLMSLGAIDFGLIIDGAVVMVENIIRHLAHRQKALGRTLNARERMEEVLISAKEVASPMFFGVAIITIVYFPILALTGIEGKMFKPMALTVIFALIGALVLALTLMPALCSYFLSGRIEEKEGFLVRQAKRFYAPLLDFALRNRAMVLLAAAIIFLTSLFVFQRLGAEFIPQLDEGSFATHMMRATSIGLDKAVEMQERSEAFLLENFPEISYTFSRIGTGEIAIDPMGPNVSDTYIFFKPESEWRKVNGRSVTKDELSRMMAQGLNGHVPGQAYLFSQPIEMRFNEILEGTRADIAVKVFGESFEEIERIATETKEILESVPGAGDVEFDNIGKAPVLEITPDRAALAKFNAHAAEINTVVSAAIAGEEAGMLVEGNRRYPIVVRLPDRLREEIDSLKQLPLRPSEHAGLITLGQVTQARVSDQVAVIAREAGQRRAAIMVNLRGRDVEGYVTEAQQKIAEHIKLPPGYSIEFGGQFKNLQEARARLAVVVPLALALVFALIFIAFSSVRQAALIFVCVPLAVTGGVFALAVRGMPFSISAGVGFIALSGIAVLNGIMLISFINQLRREGCALREAVIEGTLTRLRPKLMTALVASLGFLPMALSHGAGAEVQRPLATVVIGGIITSSLLTLVILPILYDWMESKRS